DSRAAQWAGDPRKGAAAVAESREILLKKFENVPQPRTLSAMPTIYTIGPFRLDTRAGLLFRGSEPLALGQRAVALLRALVERAGAPVSKDALMEAAW